MEYLIALDKKLLLFLNGHYSDFWNGFMYIYTSTIVWIPALLAVLLVIFHDKKREFLFILIAFAVTIAMCDLISSSLLKPLIERFRPTHDPEIQNLVHIVNGYRAGKYGFTSSHASNSFGFALLSSLLFKFKPYTIFIFLWAIVNSYSRIYLGVHFPLDIICGALIGVGSALLVYYAAVWFQRLYTGFNQKAVYLSNTTVTGFQKKNIWIPIFMLMLTVFFIAVFAMKMLKFKCY